MVWLRLKALINCRIVCDDAAILVQTGASGGPAASRPQMGVEELPRRGDGIVGRRGVISEAVAEIDTFLAARIEGMRGAGIDLQRRPMIGLVRVSGDEVDAGLGRGPIVGVADQDERIDGERRRPFPASGIE